MLYRTGLTEHPSNHVPSQTEDEDQGLQPIDRRQHHNTERRNRLALLDDQVEQVPDLLTHITISQRQGVVIFQAYGPYVCDRDWRDDGTQEIDENDRSHSKEATETAQSLDRRQLDQVVNSGVDPSTTCKYLALATATVNYW